MKLANSFRMLSVFLVLVFVLSVVTPAFAKQRPPKGPTIVDVVLKINADTGEFSTLIAALQAAGLVEMFNGNKKYTVFAPTDAAFAELGLDASNIGSLPKDQLTNILAYHVSRGFRPAASVVSVNRLRMLNGQFTSITANSSGVYINDAMVVTADVFASNGVIHVINKVLLPPAR